MDLAAAVQAVAAAVANGSKNISMNKRTIIFMMLCGNTHTWCMCAHHWANSYERDYAGRTMLCAAGLMLCCEKALAVAAGDNQLQADYWHIEPTESCDGLSWCGLECSLVGLRLLGNIHEHGPDHSCCWQTITNEHIHPDINANH